MRTNKKEPASKEATPVKGIAQKSESRPREDNGSESCAQLPPSGILRTILDSATSEAHLSLAELTVLSAQIDPYRRASPNGHRNGRWFAEVIERLVDPYEQVHLRGLHYRLVAAGDVLRPDKPLGYINTEEAWQWLSDVAAKDARWLGYVPFDRIKDERNAVPIIHVPEPESNPWPGLSQGPPVIIPDDYQSALPRFFTGLWPERQPFRIIFIGEKVSLEPVLEPITERIGAELLLPTGEASDTMVAELAARCAADSRSSVLLYFSDFDPSGWQMPISVARKLQALRDLLYPNLDIRVIPVALTLEQVRELGLPSTPLKQTEQRADRWRSIMGREQTEIDALAALDPGVLRQIAVEAVKPFWDSTLARRIEAARRAWYDEADRLLTNHPHYQDAVEQIRNGFSKLQRAVRTYNELQTNVHATLSGIRTPRINVPQAVITASSPRPLFSTDLDYITATRRLIDHKRLNGEHE